MLLMVELLVWLNWLVLLTVIHDTHQILRIEECLVLVGCLLALEKIMVEVLREILKPVLQVIVSVFLNYWLDLHEVKGSLHLTI